jgi:uncharacterized protein
VVRLAPKQVDVSVRHGHLEGLLQSPEAPSFAAVVCHPHPQMGGTMNNNVVYRLARGLYDAGAATLRFNFRGVGRSTGEYGQAVGEREDVAAALDFLSAAHPGLPLWATGFSFGARVGLEVGASDARVVKLLGVGLALSAFDMSFLLPVHKPKAFVQGEQDEFATGQEVSAFAERMAPPKHLEIVPRASHLFHGALGELESAIARAVDFLRAA